MAKSRTSRTAADQLSELRIVVERLTDTVQVLIQAVDQLTEEVQWRNNQLCGHCLSTPPIVLTSMPKDPTAKDWQINRVKPEDLPAEARNRASTNPQQSTLFE